jgi:hypothetical protein
LFSAYVPGNTKVIEYLIAMGADPNIRLDNGKILSEYIGEICPGQGGLMGGQK